jgi:hypothetical protein
MIHPLLNMRTSKALLSDRTVREYVKRGEIRGKIIGKRWSFTRADVPSAVTSVVFPELVPPDNKTLRR